MPSDTPTLAPFERRRAAGAASREETRRRLLAAADAMFRERGYPATTVAAIAKQAGYSLQTLYLAWGSKRALLRAATGAAAVGAHLPVQPEEWRSTIRAELANAVGADLNAAAYLAAVSRLFVRVADRTALYWRMHREAATTDPDIGADWEAIAGERRLTMADVAASVPRNGLRSDLTRDDITDTLWALASPEVYDLFTNEPGHDSATFESWLARTLRAALCEN